MSLCELALVFHPLTPIARLTTYLVLIEPTIEVQALKNELDSRCNSSRIGARVQLINGCAQATDFRHLVDVLHERHVVTNLHGETTLKTSHELVKLFRFKVVTKHTEDGGVDYFLHNAILFHIANGIQLNLAAGRSHNRREIADTRCRITLFETQGPPIGITQHVLIVSNRDAHTHTGTLADIVTAARQVRYLRNNLLHELRKDNLYALCGEVIALRLHNLYFMLNRQRIMRANLRTDAVLDRKSTRL